MDEPIIMLICSNWYLARGEREYGFAFSRRCVYSERCLWSLMYSKRSQTCLAFMGSSLKNSTGKSLHLGQKEWSWPSIYSPLWILMTVVSIWQTRQYLIVFVLNCSYSYDLTHSLQYNMTECKVSAQLQRRPILVITSSSGLAECCIKKEIHRSQVLNSDYLVGFWLYFYSFQKTGISQ